ncbi:MAG: 3-methyl-2-oxobutanoate hydroxymethyltransferase [Pseudomonadota bacterium]
MYTHLQPEAKERPPVTLSTLREFKRKGEKFTSLTAYDASFAARVDGAGVDVVLVGDSLGMVVQGYDSTVPVTVDDIIYHSKAVARGLHRAFLMADMPFMSYTSPDVALENAIRLMQLGGAQMVKLEGNARQLEVVEHLASRDIPVCAHLGLRPQSVHKIGGFRVQGREDDAGQAMVDDALALQNAGADIVLLECVPSPLGARITQALEVPVIGIGAGPDVDGQILVLYDILDITPGRKPRFTQNFMAGAPSIPDALAAFVDAVRSGRYPAEEHCFE